MKKYNFILNEKTHKQFISIYTKMLNKTGALQSQGFYTGRKALKSYLPSKDSNHILTISETCISYVVKEKCNFNWRVDIINKRKVLLMNDSSDSCLEFPFGKYYITDSKIEFKTMNPYSDSGYLNKVTICKDYNRALYKIEGNEAYAKQYWKDYEDEYWGTYSYVHLNNIDDIGQAISDFYIQGL